ncbi:MAG: ATP-binding protein [Treponema sp.]|jgi:predicted AAA+ superfamily ATPase|nr:ATP-binding protein [Treponema sp.]
MLNEHKRWQAENVKEALTRRRVVAVSGARQTGKTTLSQQVVIKPEDYRSLDDTFLLDYALSDPKGFVHNNTGTMVIDEVQKAPKLIPEIKQVVDNDNRPGQFLLTGSANILTLPIISDSLAGRVKYIRLRPLTVAEIMDKEPAFLQRAFDMNFPAIISGYNKETIFELAFRGGYPEAAVINNLQHRKEWHIDYINTILMRDLKDIANIRRYNDLQSLIGILASWSAKFMELSQITANLSINKSTLDSYINTLVYMYMFEKVSPWLKTDYERIGKRPKFYAADTGIMTSVLGWNLNDTIINNDRSGKLMETFVFQELAAQVDLDTKYSLFQYRDRLDREIDFLVERDDGSLLGIEVKAGHGVSKEDFKAQIWFKENIVKNKNTYVGIILYSGDRTVQFGENLLAVPTAALWL